MSCDLLQQFITVVFKGQQPASLKVNGIFNSELLVEGVQVIWTLHDCRDDYHIPRPILHASNSNCQCIAEYMYLKTVVMGKCIMVMHCKSRCSLGAVEWDTNDRFRRGTGPFQTLCFLQHQSNIYVAKHSKNRP